MRHDSCAEDADSDVEHFAIAGDFRAGQKAVGSFDPERACEEDFVGETGSDGEDQRDDKGFENAEATTLEQENEENCERREDDAEQKRNGKQKLERDGGAKDFREIAGGDGNFANEPKSDGGTARVGFPASLREVATGDDAEFGGKGLKEHRHEVAEEDYA